MRLGVCYYPEHWPEDWWPDDARRMAEMGISRVRIGEFAWSRIEPEPGQFDWSWLDRAVETLHAEGLGIIMGTPTATPPKWLVDTMPDMIAIDEQGRPRGFGSRRHYCFSHKGYAAEAARITTAMAERYGKHPAIVAWQTDNEYGCHDTVRSYSAAARDAFRIWLQRRYGDVASLNARWGNVFWSQDYRSFDDIELPNLTVTEANPAHWLDFRRFSSDQVVAFNQAQVDIIRRHSPGRDITHNFMGFFTEFDHHDVGADIDVASWDSYPLGFLEQFWFSEVDKLDYGRQGHPDIAAFHHDLYRGTVSTSRWWVMEQQPGPVNWARYNPAPLPGMVRLWTLEAMAHGAELVSYFRWRQFPMAQEQMHAGLLRPDRTDDIGAHEAHSASADIASIGPLGPPPQSVALLFDYQSDWVTSIQPQGQGFSALRLAFEWYTALRKLGLDVDIVKPGYSLAGYRAVAVPCQPIMSETLVAQLAEFAGPVLVGPRSGSKTTDFAIPATLPPGALQRELPLTVTRVESMRPGMDLPGKGFSVMRWFEHVETALEPEERLDDGRGVLFRNGHIRYLAAWPDEALLNRIILSIAAEAGLAASPMPKGVRSRRAGNHLFLFNYSLETHKVMPGRGYDAIVGGETLAPAGVSVWQRRSAD